MTKKILSIIFILMIILTVSCKQTVKKDVMEGKDVGKQAELPKVALTGEASVDAVGNDLNNVNSVEKDLSADELSDLDAGLNEVEKI